MGARNPVGVLVSKGFREKQAAGPIRSVPIFAKLEARRRGNVFPLVRRRNEEFYVREKRHAARLAFMNNAG